MGDAAHVGQAAVNAAQVANVAPAGNAAPGNMDQRMEAISLQLSAVIDASSHGKMDRATHGLIVNLIGLCTSFSNDFGIPITTKDSQKNLTRYINACGATKGGAKHKLSKVVPRVSKFTNDYLNIVKKHQLAHPAAP